MDISSDSDSEEELELTDGILLGVEQVISYTACPSKGCYNKKLVSQKCPTCNVKYKPGEETLAHRATFLVQRDSDVKELVAFTNTITKLLSHFDKNTPNVKNSELTQSIVEILPVNIEYLQTDKDILTSLVIKH